MHSKKVLFMGISTHLGGAEQSLLDFLRIYRLENPNITVMLPKKHGPLIEELDKENISVLHLALPSLFLRASQKHFLRDTFISLLQLPLFLTYLMRLRKLIETNKFETIYSTGIKCHIILCLLAPSIKAKIIIHFRDIISSTVLRAYFNLFCNQKNIKWLANSKATYNSLGNIKSQVIYNGLSQQKFYPNKTNDLKSKLSISEGTKLIGMLGVLSPWKGQAEFIRAAAKVLHEFPHCHFVIAGDQIYDTSADSDYLKNLKTLTMELKINQNIHFIGFIKEPQLFINSIDILVHASIKPEPFGRVVVEAMLCKTPIIASRAGGILEIIEENKSGLLHEPGNINELCEKMMMALDLDKMNEITENAYDFAKRNYSLEKNIQELKQIL